MMYVCYNDDVHLVLDFGWDPMHNFEENKKIHFSAQKSALLMKQNFLIGQIRNLLSIWLKHLG